MDIIFRLRVVFWALTLSLWGLMLQQFLVEEKSPQVVSQVRAPGSDIFHRILSNTTQPAFPSMESSPAPAASAPPAPTPAVSPAPAPAFSAALPLGPASQNRLAASPGPIPGIQTRAPPPAMLFPIAHSRPPGPAPAPAVPFVKKSRPAPSPAAPPGFHLAQTRHFLVYDEENTDPRLLDTLESLHGNLMLDLASFAPWAQDEQKRVSIYLFDTQNSYQRMTGRPAWSGGASSLSQRTIYVYKSDEMIGILAHELTHVYFDGFFRGGHLDPLWLSEGMATLVQTERGLAAPNWLAGNLQKLKEGEGYGLEELMKVETMAGASDDAVRLWYTQSYSLVRFLLRLQRGPSFFRFCRLLKSGQPLNRALLASYGMPFNRVKALELAWRYDVEKKTLTANAAGSAGL